MKRITLIIIICSLLLSACAGGNPDTEPEETIENIETNEDMMNNSDDTIIISNYVENKIVDIEHDVFKEAAIKGYLLYWDILGTIQEIYNNSEDGMRWLSGGIYWNYCTEIDGMTYEKAEEIAERMKSKQLPNNLFFIIEDEYDPDPRELFMETDMFKNSWGSQLIARDITDVRLYSLNDELKIIRVSEPTQVEAFGDIMNTYGFGADLFSYAQYQEMLDTEGVYFYLAEYEGEPVGMCMAQDGNHFVSIPWFEETDDFTGYDVLEYLVNAAEYDAFVREKIISVMDVGLNRMLSDLGYEEYARTVQIVLK